MGSCKEGTGKCLVFFSTIVFALGVIASCVSPQWIQFSATDTSGGNQNEVVEIQYGPFYSQERTCVGSQCSAWVTDSVNLNDCDSIQGAEASKLCSHLLTWRTLAILCLIIVVVGGCIVLLGSCCQCFTCGCCGGSMDCVANVMFWIEVVLSICAWSFAISSLRKIKEAPQVLSTGYMWGFWIFLVSGTILGAISATMADWAAETSCFRSIFRCLTCRRNKE